MQRTKGLSTFLRRRKAIEGLGEKLGSEEETCAAKGGRDSLHSKGKGKRGGVDGGWF